MYLAISILTRKDIMCIDAFNILEALNCIRNYKYRYHKFGHYERRVRNNTLKITSNQNSQTVIEQLWLSYYNDTLYAKGIISEENRNKMRTKIKNRAANISN